MSRARVVEVLNDAVEADALLSPAKIAGTDAPGAGTAPPGGTGWPKPTGLPDTLPPVAAFDPKLLPATLRPWVEDIAERMQCPPDFPAIGAMVALSAVVGRQVAIRPKQRDDWTVVPNLWGAVVGRPSVMKSPALAEAMRPLNALEAEARERFEAEIRQHEAAAMVQAEAKKVTADRIRKALKAGTDASAYALDALTDERAAPARRRYKTSDSTVEKLGELLRDNPRGLLVFRDELTGFLRSLDKEGAEGSRAFYLEAWNGNGEYIADRIGRGTVDIEGACVAVLGGIQPGPLAGYLRDALRGGALDDGLMQRFQLLVWPDDPHEWRDVDRWPDSKARQQAVEVFGRLDRLDDGRLIAELDDGDRRALPFVRFAPEVQEMFGEWRTTLEMRLRARTDAPAVEAHLTKYRKLVPALALLCHLADRPSGGPVVPSALVRACAWAEYLESHARRLYGAQTLGEIEAARELLRRLRRGDLPQPFTLRDVYRPCWRLLDRDGAAAAVQLLMDHDWLRCERDADTGGRPSLRYVAHPRALPEQPA